MCVCGGGVKFETVYVRVCAEHSVIADNDKHTSCLLVLIK